MGISFIFFEPRIEQKRLDHALACDIIEHRSSTKKFSKIKTKSHPLKYKISITKFLEIEGILEQDSVNNSGIL